MKIAIIGGGYLIGDPLGMDLEPEAADLAVREGVWTHDIGQCAVEPNLGTQFRQRVQQEFGWAGP